MSEIGAYGKRQLKCLLAFLTAPVLLGFVPGLASDVAPDPDELWKQHREAELKSDVKVSTFDPKTGRYTLPQPESLDSKESRLKDSRKTYMFAVKKAIEQVEQRKPLTIPAYGLRGLSFVQIDKNFGVPKDEHGCVLTGEDYRLDPGFFDVLSWYAARDIYPINSVNSHVLKAVPTDLVWHPLLKDYKDRKEIPAGPVVARLIKRTGGAPAISLTQGAQAPIIITWPHFSAFEPSDPKAAADDFSIVGCEWAFHQPTRTLFLRGKSSLGDTGSDTTLQISPAQDLVIAEFRKDLDQTSYNRLLHEKEETEKLAAEKPKKPAKSGHAPTHAPVPATSHAAGATAAGATAAGAMTPEEIMKLPPPPFPETDHRAQSAGW